MASAVLALCSTPTHSLCSCCARPPCSTETPAQQMLTILKAVLEGLPAPMAMVVAVQRALQQSVDVYRPPNKELEDRLNEANLDVSAPHMLHAADLRRVLERCALRHGRPPSARHMVPARRRKPARPWRASWARTRPGAWCWTTRSAAAAWHRVSAPPVVRSCRTRS